MQARVVLLTTFAAAFGLACGPAYARSLQVAGTAGYLSEWEIKATVAENVSGGGELVGPITWKHTGLCTTNGPVEKAGEIKLRISGWGPLSRVDATMSFENATCTYSGRFSEGTTGHMDCSDAKGVPLAFSIR
jgi:hypothetical protein